MAYPNLEAEMKRHGYGRQKVADLLGMSVSAVYPILAGKRPLTLKKAVIIRNALFPDMRIDYLFDENPLDNNSADLRA